MRVPAIYENGSIRIKQALRFKRDTFDLEIDIPEEVLEAPQMKHQASELVDSWVVRLEEIRREVLATPEDQLPEISEKQLERIRAFSERADR